MVEKKQSSRYIMRSAHKKKRRPFIYDNPYEDFVCETFSPTSSKSVPRPNETELVAINLHEQGLHNGHHSLPHAEQLRFAASCKPSRKPGTHPYQRRRKLLRWIKSRWAFCGVFCLLLSVLVVSLGWKRRQQQQTTLAPRGPPRPPATLLSMSDYLVRIHVAQAVQLQDHTSPQYYAVEWLTQVDKASLPTTDGQEEQFTLVTRYVLAVLFFSLHGAQWGDRLQFLTPQEHVCTWQGTVTINQEQRTLGVFCDAATMQIPKLLRLNHNSLKGTIPREIALLTTLEEFNLQANSISGTVPVDLCGLPDLQRIRVDNNVLTGTVPACLSILPQLEYLYLADNRLTGALPNELASATSLRRLVVGGNSLTGDPLGIFEALRQLEWIFCENNLFQGPLFRHFLRDHAHLTYLDLSGNEFFLDTFFPHHLLALPSLQILDVSNNKLRGVMEATTASDTNTDLFHRLAYLSLANNQLHGPLPLYLQNLQNLRHLDISHNLFTGDLPTFLGSLVQLRYLSVASNPFLIGLVPPEYAQWQYLVDLNLHDTGRAGHIPDFLATNNSDLSFVDLGRNQFTGSIPTSLGALTHLQHLFLNDNDISGTLPASWTQLQDLTNLFVQGNHRLTGDVNFLCPALARRERIFTDCELPCACCECCAATVLPNDCTGTHMEEILQGRYAQTRRPYYGYFEDNTN